MNKKPKKKTLHQVDKHESMGQGPLLNAQQLNQSEAIRKNENEITCHINKKSTPTAAMGGSSTLQGGGDG